MRYSSSQFFTNGMFCFESKKLHLSLSVVIILIDCLLISCNTLINNTMSTLSHSQSTLLPRITVIDALRGFTLFGIIIVHMIEQYYAGPIPEKYAVKPTLVDTIVSAAILDFNQW